MSESIILIKNYFDSRRGDRLSGFVSQVDHLAKLAACVAQADFVAVFYNDQDRVIPLAYYGLMHSQLPYLKRLEEQWCRTAGADEMDKSGGGPADAGVPQPVSDDDMFARQHGLKYVRQWACHEKGRRHGSIVAYWSQKPAGDQALVNKSLGYIADTLAGAIVAAHEMQILGDYLSRWSELVSIFEIPSGQIKFGELLEKLVEVVHRVVPQASFGLFRHESSTNTFRMVEQVGPLAPTPSFQQSLITRLPGLYEASSASSELKGTWIDWSDGYPEQYTAVMGAAISTDPACQVVLVAWTNQVGGLSQNDRELLSVFCLFARNVISLALLLRNLTQVNDVLQRSSQQLADAETMAALADMASGIAHDFNNIMGGVVGRVQLMKLKVKEGPVFDGLNNIEEMIMEGARTVRRIQEFTTSAKYKKLEPVDFVNIVASYFAAPELPWKQLARDKGVTVDVKKFIDKTCVMGATEDLISVVDKLVENAVEYANNNTVVQILLAADKKYCRLTIANQGPVIDEGAQKKIFYPFFSTKGKRGAGLGLAIVHGIVSRHSGQIEVHSGEETGTVFTVKIPRAERREEDSDITRKKQRVSNLRILVVDDDKQIRDVLCDILTIDGHQTTPCSDGYSALKAFETKEFDLLITDLGMPGMSGLDLAGMVHRNKPELPIAIISGWGSQLNHDEVALKGIKAVLSKPFHLKDIKAMIEELAHA